MFHLMLTQTHLSRNRACIKTGKQYLEQAQPTTQDVVPASHHTMLELPQIYALSLHATALLPHIDSRNQKKYKNAPSCIIRACFRLDPKLVAGSVPIFFQDLVRRPVRLHATSATGKARQQLPVHALVGHVVRGGPAVRRQALGVVHVRPASVWRRGPSGRHARSCARKALPRRKVAGRQG